MLYIHDYESPLQSCDRIVMKPHHSVLEDESEFDHELWVDSISDLTESDDDETDIEGFRFDGDSEGAH